MPGYVVPDDWDGVSYICTQVSWPDSAEWLGLLRGALSGFSFDFVWDADTGDVEAAVAVALDIIARNTVGGEFPPRGCVERMIGEVTMWSGQAPPPGGWLICRGQEVSRTTYADLFDVIGTTYGSGDGSSTFNLPDLLTKFPLGASDIGGIGVPRGDSGGETEHTLTTDEMPSHRHTTNGFDAVGWHRPGQPQSGGNNLMTYDASYTAIPLDNAGGGQAHNNMPPYLAIFFIIFAGEQ